MKIAISRSQKIALLFAVLLPITGTIYFLGYHDFAPNPALFWPSFAFSIIITVGMVVFSFIKHRNGSWKSAKKIDSLKDKIIFYLFAPLALYFYLILHTYIVAPRIYTSIFGAEVTVMEKVRTKDKNYGRHKIFDYSIELESYKALALEICITQRIYFSALDIGDTVQVNIIKSPVGSIIQSVSISK